MLRRAMILGWPTYMWITKMESKIHNYLDHCGPFNNKTCVMLIYPLSHKLVRIPKVIVIDSFSVFQTKELWNRLFL